MHLPKLSSRSSLVQKLRVAIVLVVLSASAVLIARFFIRHPQYITTLKNVKPLSLVLLLGLNALLILILVMVYDFTLQLCGKRISFKENILLTSYSAIINFFGPLQSGPGVRAVYLKTRHQIRIRDYTLASLIYYSIFAMTNALFLFTGSLALWETILIVVAVGAVCFGVINLFLRKHAKDKTPFHLVFNPGVLWGLVLATVAQVFILTVCYFVELRAIGAHISFHQAVIYSGAANFALFVSLTPDAIGFRESFLVLSKRLHRISTAAIVTANVLDRAIYVVFLGLLLILVVAIHGRDRLAAYWSQKPV